MVNLDKLIDSKETCNKFTLETNEQLTTNNDEINSKQHDLPVSPKQSFDNNSPSSLNEDELEEEDNELNNLNENQESSLNNDNFNNETENEVNVLKINNNEELTNNQEQQIDTGLIIPEEDDDDEEPNLEICDENDENFSKSEFNDKNQTNLQFHVNGIKKENNQFYYLNFKWPNNSQLNIIFDQLRNMYIEQQLLDCTLVCENQCIKAHKLILAAVSPYFRSIFYSFNSLGCNNTAVMLQNIPARDMRLIIRILYSINDYNNPLKLSTNRAISLRKSVYRLKIDFINDQLDQCGVPQLNEKFIDNLINENELFNLDLSKNNRKRKRSFCDENLNSNKINSIENLQDKQSCSDSADDISSECSTTMKHHKFKHKYLLSDEHLEQNDKIVKCGNDILEREYLEDDMIEEENYDQQIEEDIEEDNNTNLNINDKSDLQNENDRKLNDNNDKQLKSNLNSLNQNTQKDEFNEKIIDFSAAKISSQEDLIKLMNNSINNENADKVANLYKAMKKLCSANSESMNNDNLNQINKSQNFANDILNSTFSQLCMAGSNLNNLSGLNSDTARALLFTNELLKNNTNNQLHHSKNSADNSLNTSTSSTTSSSTNNNGNSQVNNTATAALVAAAQQHILNASFLNKNSNKQNSNVLLNSNSKSNGLSSSNNYSSLQNGLSSGNNSGVVSGMQPVKRGRGRPPRHTQPNGSDSGSINEDLPLNKSQHTKLQQSIKQQLTSNTSSSINNINNLSNLTGLNNSSTNSIANSLSVLTQQHKKWRPNLENLLALKIGKNKLNSNSPTNDLNSQLQNTQANLLKNDLINKSLSSSSNNSGISNHYSQNGGSPSLNNNNNSTTSSTTNSSVNNINGNTANSNNNNAEGKNTCLYCPQVYYSTQAMNDHINNVHTKTAFKYICEFCSKEFSWKISLTKHLKHAHGDLNTFGPRSLGLSVQNLNGLTSAISNHLNAANSLTNQELLHSFMNQRDNESAMLNFGAIGD